MLFPSQFIHHVYFWLNNPGSKADYEALLAGLQELTKVPGIKHFHIGVPANTSRDVIETTYDFSWLLVFDTAAEQDAYQTDPIHLQFVATCRHLWKKVVVYDSVGK